jgi:xanthine dehydrogenase small subunit
MKHSTAFICNNKKIITDVPPGTAVLDFLREHEHLTGTKAACREGDCGSCTILVGSLDNAGQAVNYNAMTSCLLPLGDMEGKHIVSIEGLNPEMESTMSDIPVTPVQEIFVREGATQCGFCTPGFVISLTCFLLRNMPLSEEKGLEAVSGNVCRCTGYGSILRCIRGLVKEYGPKLDGSKDRLDVLIEEGIVPSYFREIPRRLRGLSGDAAVQPVEEAGGAERRVLVAGGTDLYVQKPEALAEAAVSFVSRKAGLRGTVRGDGRVRIGAGTSMEELKDDLVLHEIFPDFPRYMHLIASKQIRQRATVGGNLVNASPIGDLSVFFLSLGAEAGIRSVGGDRRRAPLRNFFIRYKTLDLQPGEELEYVEFALPAGNALVNFEKVSRRRHLDIASVNSAVKITTEQQGNSLLITEIGLSAGGVAPVPLFLAETAEFCRGKELSAETIREAAARADGEISPISDVRGSEQYKRLLLRQLLFAHFITLFPDIFAGGGLV